MNAIPEDIKRTAISAIDSVTTFPDGTYPDEAYNIIALAILAERQRCADIAERVSEQSYENSVYPVERIRAAILAGGTA